MSHSYALCVVFPFSVCRLSLSYLLRRLVMIVWKPLRSYSISGAIKERRETFSWSKKNKLFRLIVLSKNVIYHFGPGERSERVLGTIKQFVHTLTLPLKRNTLFVPKLKIYSAHISTATEETARDKCYLEVKLMSNTSKWRFLLAIESSSVA